MDGSTLSAGTGAPTKPSITAPISPDKKSHSGATNNTLQPITNSPNQPVTLPGSKQNAQDLRKTFPDRPEARPINRKKLLSTDNPSNKKRGRDRSLPLRDSVTHRRSTNNCSTSNYRILSVIFFNCASTSKSTFTVASFLGVLKIVAFPWSIRSRSI